MSSAPNIPPPDVGVLACEGMRVLLATGSAARYMRPPQLGALQVNCGPDWLDARDAAGRVVSLQTPAGDYDLAAIAAKLPAAQQPDAVVCLVDASWRNTPRNLAAFKCPRVLLIADTHHLQSPLIGMLRYASSEPFDRAALLYDRHHAAFFHAAGFRDLAWLPGLTFPHADAAVRAARTKAQREQRIGFVGQAGKHHPRRSRLLGALAAAKLPVVAKPLRQDEALAFYGASAVGFNASLNGDVNLRVLEVLAAGAALLTDRLVEGAGLSALVEEGKSVVTYGSEADLPDIARDLLRDRAKAAAIGAAGGHWFDTHWNEEKRREAFWRFVHDGAVPDRFAFSAAAKTRVFFGGDTDRLLQTAMVYEGIQEIHRGQENVVVQVDPAAAADEIAELCGTLPRVQVVRGEGDTTPDVAIFSREGAREHGLARAQHLWCWDARADDFATLAEQFGRLGFGLVSEDVAVFGRLQSADERGTVAKGLELVRQAVELKQRGDLDGAFARARSALEVDERSVEARVLLGELVLRRSDGGAMAETLFQQALELRPSDIAAELGLADALKAQKKFEPARQRLEGVLKREPRNLRALIAVAHLRMEDREFSAAEATLRTAWLHHPGTKPVALALGHALKQQGRLTEALAWHRRSVGGEGEVRAARGALRHVVFVVQHAPQWSSLATVIAAFRADPSWRTTVVALPYHHPYLPSPEARNAIFGFLERENVPSVRWDQFSLQESGADVVFLQNPYDVTRPKGWKTEDVLRLVPRIAYVPYGIEIGGTRENAANQFAMPLHRLAWAIFARSEDHRAQFARMCPVGAAHVAVTGHPKFDPLADLASHVDPELQAFAAGRPLVLWNPQFDIRPDGSGYSTFLQWWQLLPKAFAERPELAFVIRPHPLFFSTLVSRQILTAAQIEDFRARCREAGNVMFDQRESYLPVFASATAMISDGSSFLIEFGATGKPICYLHNPRGPLAKPHYDVDFSFVREHCTWATRPEQIAAFLDALSAGADARKSERTAAIRQRLALGGGAGAAIKQVIEARLATEALAARTASAA